MRFIWGIDLGGTKIEGVVLSPQNLALPLCRVRVPTESAKGYEHILSQIQHLIKQMSSDVGGALPDEIGMGLPGAFDHNINAMKNSNTTVLNGKNVPKDLMTRLGVSVVTANDANCFALAEARLGAGRGASVAFGVIIGTGVGGGLVIDGKIINGKQSIAGEWGHLCIDETAPKNYSGIPGVVESFISGPALEKFYESLSGKPLRLEEIAEQHDAGNNPHATATINRLTHYFGRSLSAIINIIDPDVIIVGGGVGNIDALYTDGIESLKKFVFNTRLDTRIVKPELGDSAGVFGAAMLVADAP
jgi:fructokinase